MATFQPNPNEQNEPWIEKSAIDGFGFRIWHVICFCFAGVLALIILFCCCVKIRVPRTKQEIEADYQRKKITRKFREKLRMIQNHDMDAMDLKKALEIIRSDLKEENAENQIAVQIYPAANSNIEDDSKNTVSMEAEPQQSTSGGFTKKFSTVIKPFN